MTATQTTVTYTPRVNWAEVYGRLPKAVQTWPMGRAPRNFEDAKAWFDAVHAQLRVTIDNLVGMAERAMERFDSTGDVAELKVARDAMDEAAPYIQERAEIEALWVKA